jgi:hypothetical protein
MLTKYLPYILAYKSRNFGRILNSFSVIRLIHGSQKQAIYVDGRGGRRKAAEVRRAAAGGRVVSNNGYLI